METLRWITLAACCLFFVEGFVLSLFPEQLKQLIAEAEPRSLQLAGWAETALAFGLLAALILQ